MDESFMIHCRSRIPYDVVRKLETYNFTVNYFTLSRSRSRATCRFLL
jgi:hypothetical protein